MFDHFSFINPKAEEKKTRPMPEVLIAPPRPSLVRLERQDLDAALFGASLMILVMLVVAARETDVVRVAYSGLLTFFTVESVVYGLRVMRIAGPQTARTIFEVRQAWKPKLDGEDERASPPPADEAPSDTPLTREELWRSAFREYLAVAKIVRGYTHSKMAEDLKDHKGKIKRRKYMTSTTWRTLTPWLKKNKILHEYPEGTELEPGLDYTEAVRRIQHGHLLLPNEDPPQRVMLR